MCVVTCLTSNSYDHVSMFKIFESNVQIQPPSFHPPLHLPRSNPECGKRHGSVCDHVRAIPRVQGAGRSNGCWTRHGPRVRVGVCPRQRHKRRHRNLLDMPWHCPSPLPRDVGIRQQHDHDTSTSTTTTRAPAQHGHEHEHKQPRLVVEALRDGAHNDENDDELPPAQDVSCPSPSSSPTPCRLLLCPPILFERCWYPHTTSSPLPALAPMHSIQGLFIPTCRLVLLADSCALAVCMYCCSCIIDNIFIFYSQIL